MMTCQSFYYSFAALKITVLRSCLQTLSEFTILGYSIPN